MTDIQLSVKPVHGPHAADLTALCEVLELTPEKFANDLYTLCRWMQENMHYGVYEHDIKFANEQLTNNGQPPLPGYLLNEAYIGKVYDGMLYCSSSRKFAGWGVNMRDILKSEKYEVWKWEQTWLEKLGYLHPERAEKIQLRIDAITRANERKPQRRHDEPWLEHKPTVEIAHYRELCQLMAEWMWSFRALWGIGDDAFTFLQAMWQKKVHVFTAELEYRTEAEPEKRTSKKKTEAAKQDFRDAALWLTGINQIYSPEFKAMVKKSALPFDLHIDYDNLPVQPPEQMPVMKMDYYHLMDEFIRWVSENEIDPDTFEGEDARLLKSTLHDALRTALEDKRKALARAKNQHVKTQEFDS